MKTSPNIKTPKAKKPAKAAPRAKRCPNIELALTTIAECVKAVCDCGHFDDEHYSSSERRRCAECACPSFKAPFTLDGVK